MELFRIASCDNELMNISSDDNELMNISSDDNASLHISLDAIMPSSILIISPLPHRPPPTPRPCGQHADRLIADRWSAYKARSLTTTSPFSWNTPSYTPH